MRNDSDVQAAVHAFRLVMPTISATGRTGDLMGLGAGNSLEFQEYREYSPGDDVRHLDWAAYARSDALMVRLYREEISPRTDILLDASCSMATSTVKQTVARQLSAALLLWTTGVGGSAAMTLLDDAKPAMKFGLPELDRLSTTPFVGCMALPDVLAREAAGFRAQAVRILISDFLFEGDPEPVIRTAANGAGALWVVQLLSRWESDPVPFGGRRLVDVESGAEADVVLNPVAVAEYRRRLNAVQNSIREACRRVRGRFVALIADDGLPSLCRHDLCKAGWLEPG